LGLKLFDVARNITQESMAQHHNANCQHLSPLKMAGAMIDNCQPSSALSSSAKQQQRIGGLK